MRYNGDLMEVAAQKAARNIGLFGAEDMQTHAHTRTHTRTHVSVGREDCAAGS